MNSAIAQVTMLQSGTTIQGGKYSIKETLGSGGFGDVYGAIEISTGASLAIKVLKPKSALTTEAHRDLQRKRFVQEANLGKKIKHHNVIEVFGYVHDKDLGLDGIVMERAKQTFAQRLAEFPKGVPTSEAVDLLRGAAEGLLALNEELHLVHRDVTLKNILIGADGRAKISDLGTAQVNGRGIEVDTYTSDSLMQRFEFVFGRSQYASPEHYSGGTLRPTSDVYSLGCVAFELLTGKKWVNEEQHTTKNSKLCGEVPVWLDDVVRRMLSRKPGMDADDARKSDKRFVNMRGVIAAIDAGLKKEQKSQAARMAAASVLAWPHSVYSSLTQRMATTGECAQRIILAANGKALLVTKCLEKIGARLRIGISSRVLGRRLARAKGFPGRAAISVIVLLVICSVAVALFAGLAAPKLEMTSVANQILPNSVTSSQIPARSPTGIAASEIPVASMTPIVTRTASPTSSSTPLPTGTATKFPTATASPTVAPTSLPSTTPVPPTRAPAVPAVPRTTGCAGLAAGESRRRVTFELFDRGLMVAFARVNDPGFRGSGEFIAVIADDGRTWCLLDTFSAVPGASWYSCEDPGPGVPPERSYVPWRGFGLVWCTHPDIKSAVGRARSGERGGDQELIQVDVTLMPGVLKFNILDWKEIDPWQHRGSITVNLVSSR